MLTEARDDAWVRDRIAELPGSAIAALQQGPARIGCRVCDVLRPLEPDDPKPGRSLLATGCTATDLLDYHAIEGPPDAPCSVQASPEDRDECFRRCLQIYRAAGWIDAA